MDGARLGAVVTATADDEPIEELDADDMDDVDPFNSGFSWLIRI